MVGSANAVGISLIAITDVKMVIDSKAVNNLLLKFIHKINYNIRFSIHHFLGVQRHFSLYMKMVI